MSHGYHARLVRRDGVIREFDAPTSIGLDIEHTTVSGLTVEVPAQGGLGEFAFGHLDLLFEGERIFRALAEEVPIPTPHTETVTLAGRGEARELARGATTYSIEQEFGYVAIADAWSAVAPQWEVDVTQPAPGEESVVSEFEKGGTPLEILRDLHDEAGYRFTVRHDVADKTVHSYPRGEVGQTPEWTVLDRGTPTLDVSGYANRVVVRGKRRDDGKRPASTVRDADEVARLEEVFGFDDGHVTWSVTDPSKTTEEGCNSKAESILADRIQEDALSGELGITPRLVLPGYHYEIPEWSEDSENPMVLSVDTVSIEEDLTFDSGEPSATVAINAPGGLADVVGVSVRDQASIKSSI